MTRNTPARRPARNATALRSKRARMTGKQKIDEERGFARGVALACGIIQSYWDQPMYCAEVLNACGFETRAKLKAAGAEDYDLKLLKPVFEYIKERSA